MMEMGTIYLCSYNASRALPFLCFISPEKKSGNSLLTSAAQTDGCCASISAAQFGYSVFSSSPSSFRARCSSANGSTGYSGDEPGTHSWAYGVLGLEPHCSSSQLKAAFRSKVKQFHPDLIRDGKQSDIEIRQVIQAYEILSNSSKSEIIERECMDPFDQPECEAFDLFVNEVLCIGTRCPYSCVNMAPYAFQFSSITGTAHATSQGHSEDYRVEAAVGRCPRSCIHYVTPSQRIILEELLQSFLCMPYDTSSEADLLYSLLVKAKYENNRYQNPDKDSKVSSNSSKHVDWL